MRLTEPAILVAACAAWCAGVAQAGAPEVKPRPMPTNGSFESTELTLRLKLKDRVLDGWNFGRQPYMWMPTDWHLLSGGPAEMRLVEGRRGREVHTGRRALYMNVADKRDVHMLGDPLLALGGAYEYAFWCKGSGRPALVVYLFQRRATGRPKYLGPALLARVQARTGWKRHHKRFTASWSRPGATHFRPGLVPSGKVWIDDLRMIRIGDTAKGATLGRGDSSDSGSAGPG